MALNRRSARLAGLPAAATITELVEPTSYPDMAPSGRFEHLICRLNRQSIPYRKLSSVDDKLVYALFASKKHSGRDLSWIPEKVGMEPVEVSVEDATKVARICRSQGRENVETVEKNVQQMVNNIYLEVPEMFSKAERGALEKYRTFCFREDLV